MDARTLEALKASIKHWEANLNAEQAEEVTIGPDDCPLCNLFNTMEVACKDQTCAGCPVFERTGEELCESTPYVKAYGRARDWKNDAKNTVRSRAFKAAAKREVDFLRFLLPASEEAV